MSRTETDLRTTYADLLAREDDGAYLATVGALEAGYSLVEPPASLWQRVPRGVPGGAWVQTTPRSGRKLKHIVRWGWYAAILAVAISVLVSYAARPTSSVTDLGKPTNAVIDDMPLIGFSHTGPILHSGRLPEILVIGTQEDPDSGVARWPIVKALDQFGRLTGVASSASTMCPFNGGYVGRCITSVPTFDWSHAHFASRYLAFVHRDLTDHSGRLYQRLSPAELSLFYRYAAVREATYAQTVKETVDNTNGLLPSAPAGRLFPLISIGGYLRTDVGALTVGDFMPPGPARPRSSSPIIPFATVQNALQRGRPGGAVLPSLLADVNAEANVITALICHADHSQPRSVCSRTVIKGLLRHMK